MLLLLLFIIVIIIIVIIIIIIIIIIITFISSVLIYVKGTDCMPVKRQLSRMFDSFEAGIYTSHWARVSGGGIGFGCGALLPYAHGKTLYFNSCGLREARTVEMDLTRAR